MKAAKIGDKNSGIVADKWETMQRPSVFATHGDGNDNLYRKRRTATETLEPAPGGSSNRNLNNQRTLNRIKMESDQIKHENPRRK
jgi:hypothetical protein